MSNQKFHKNDLVRVAKDLGSCMSHFTADCDAIVVASYSEKYGGGRDEDDHTYTIILLPGYNETSWYYESQLTFLRHLSDEEAAKLKADADAIEAKEKELDWIVDNWKAMKAKGSYSAHSVAKLMELIGITNPWGSRGEGFTYYENAYATIAALGPSIESGNIQTVKARIAEIKDKYFSQPK